ncbi:BCCT family transporter [Fusobacterium sp. PH5-29]|uniref:BCCT family transporter n=1 Tax=Fusobacterium sp. PH5-29 TaxID=1742400 RepID=UPI003D2314D5
MNGINDWIIKNVGWLFSCIAVFTVLVGVVAAFSKFGDVRIGGKDAKPEISTFSWFTIALTTTMAAGVLFWGPAEPIAHFGSPATELTGILPQTKEAVKFSMETMFLHWTFIPYAIYTVPAVVFAFMYYNARKPFSISSEMAPILGSFSDNEKVSKIIDAMTLFCIGAGMAGSLGQGILNMSGGIANILKINSTASLWLIVAVIITIVFVATAISGIKKGIKICADINVYGYVAFLSFLLLFGGTAFVFNLGTEAFGGFLSNFFEKALSTGASSNSQWPQWWTTFYWASWMAWAPTSGAFMGRIAYGRTIKQTLGLYIGVCSLVSATWMILVGGNSLFAQITGKVDLLNVYNNVAVEAVPYKLLESMPLSKLTIPLFLILIFLSVVTACNSNMIAMAGISTSGITPESPEAPGYLKIVWGIVVISLAYIMISLVGINGVKIIANFGGMFAGIIMLGTTLSLGVLIFNHKKFDKTCQQE